MYHVIATPSADAPYPDLFVPPHEFAQQMGWLAEHGYHAVTLLHVYEAWQGRALLPPNPVVISFDDGYRTQFTNALPLLRALRWPGVLDLEVRDQTRPWGLSPARVRALVAAGWELDSHTITHPDLTTVDAVRLRREVAGSRTILQTEFHVPVDFFCYPSGRYDDAVVAAVRAAGYLGATTTRYGLASPDEVYALRRVRVDEKDDLARFSAKLTGLRP
jgi:peptidoglycan/xylan/chitin deacetylase (PgdA/CDA1 family)